MTSKTCSTRRVFLRNTAVATCSLVGASFVSPSQATAAPNPIALKPVLSWLGSFASNIAASVIPELLLDWIRGGSDTTRTTASDAVDDISTRGYTEYNNSVVYTQNNSYYFYGAADNSNFQALAPFQYSPGYYTVLGGPAIMAVNALHGGLVRNYKRMSRSDLSFGVLPTGPVDLACYCFSFTEPWAASYQTAWGYVQLSYTPTSQPYINRQRQQVVGQGTLSAKSKKSQRATYTDVGQTIYFV